MFETAVDYSDIGENKDDYNDMFNDDVDSSFRPLHRKTMAVTKGPDQQERGSYLHHDDGESEHSRSRWQNLNPQW